MLKLEHISFSYGEVKTLNEVSITAEPKRVTCVMGRNGVGKTTLLKNIMGILRSSSGRMSLNGQDIGSLPPNLRAK